MRITLTKKEVEDLVCILYEIEEDNTYNKRAVELVHRLCHEEEQFLKSITNKKRTATKAANKAKSEKSRKSIEDAIDVLKIDNKKITIYAVSKTANISYSTAKKYKDLFVF